MNYVKKPKRLAFFQHKSNLLNKHNRLAVSQVNNHPSLPFITNDGTKVRIRNNVKFQGACLANTLAENNTL